MVSIKFLLFLYSFPGFSALHSVFSIHLYPFPILNLVMARTFSNSKGLITALNSWSNLHRLSRGVVGSFSPQEESWRKQKQFTLPRSPLCNLPSSQWSDASRLLVYPFCLLHLSSFRARADAEQSSLYNLGFI